MVTLSLYAFFLCNLFICIEINTYKIKLTILSNSVIFSNSVLDWNHFHVLLNCLCLSLLSLKIINGLLFLWIHLLHTVLISVTNFRISDESSLRKGLFSCVCMLVEATDNLCLSLSSFETVESLPALRDVWGRSPCPTGISLGLPHLFSSSSTRVTGI